jgi:hypothetical protein
LGKEAWLPIVIGVWCPQLEEDVSAIVVARMAEKYLKLTVLNK